MSSQKHVPRAIAAIAGTRPKKAIRTVLFALTLTLIGTLSMAQSSAAQTQAASPITTGVMVILTVKAGVTRDQVMAVMPTEIRQTVQLYLNGKVRQWYSRSDGRGVVLLLDTRDVAEAHTIMESLPLARQDLMDHEYIAVGPLMPLGLLAANPERRQ
jgi:hypothetical protein